MKLHYICLYTEIQAGSQFEAPFDGQTPIRRPYASSVPNLSQGIIVIELLSLCFNLPSCKISLFQPFMTPNSLSRHMKTHDQAAHSADEPGTSSSSASTAHFAALVFEVMCNFFKTHSSRIHWFCRLLESLPDLLDFQAKVDRGLQRRSRTRSRMDLWR